MPYLDARHDHGYTAVAWAILIARVCHLEGRHAADGDLS